MERYRTTLIMLGALVLLVVVWLLLRGNPAVSSSGSTTPTATPEPYVWQESSDVNYVDVVSGTTTVSLRKDMSTTVWSLVSPIKDTADSFSVSSEADSLKSLQATAVLTSPTDLAQYGLDKPPLKVTVKTAAATPAEHTLQVGNATIDGAGYYTLADGKKDVYVIANSIIEPLKSWITTPPKAPPTATPAPATPTERAVPSGTVPAGGSATVTLPLTSTTTITGSETITNTQPGAANPTTPLASPTK